MTDAELAAIRDDNERLRRRLVVVAHDHELRMSWDEAADGVDRTDKLLAEVERLQDEMASMHRDNREIADR